MAAPNANTINSRFQVQVAAGAGNADLIASYRTAYASAGKSTLAPAADLACAAIRLHAAGTLVYTNRDGVVVTLTEMPAGLEPIEATAIGAGTNVKVTCYF